MRSVMVASVMSLVACGGSELGGEVDCTPGDMIRIGCDGLVGRECAGRPRMALCDGRLSRDECGPNTPAPDLLVVQNPPGCPNRIVTCPASGSIVVQIEQGGSGPFTCTWDHQVITP
jgi:hypothetical protein